MDDRQHSTWREIPVEELRRFMAELVQDSNLREAGRLIRRGREAVRKFVSGDIEMPHDRTRKAIAVLYQQKYGTGARRMSEVAQATPTATPLKLILPRGVERASAEIRAAFDPLRPNGAELPPTTAAIERWLLRRVKEEYAEEVPYARPRQRAPRKKKPPPDAG
ncbi:hypothetical protein [Longimicrobium sp.]|uniref:hypothetical protein n=1 Tax=Longimicrobium sp. TaxID=2029185 RepID=UPI002CED44C0|nr:hypothetical protein [Longimicrobium sp.]HSU13824.1 hypothetical protein [Longimicrobium sp.]